jgi:hypothetical protein
MGVTGKLIVATSHLGSLLNLLIGSPPRELLDRSDLLKRVACSWLRMLAQDQNHHGYNALLGSGTSNSEHDPHIHLSKVCAVTEQ